MKLQELIEKSETIFVLDRESGKVVFSIDKIPADLQRVINSVSKMNFKVVQIETEGWNIITSKYHLHPVSLIGMSSENYTLLQNDTTTAIVKPSEKLDRFFENVRKRSLEDLVLGKFIEVAGTLSPCGEEYDIKGDLNEEEIRLINSIIHANDSLAGLIGEMISLISGIIWYPLKGWFIVGEEHALVSIFGKWVIIPSRIFEEILSEGE
jgi:roadblock/LC7 domain-containing protein